MTLTLRMLRALTSRRPGDWPRIGAAVL